MKKGHVDWAYVDWPASLRDAVVRWGTPVGVEDARKDWARLIDSAKAGVPTLITYERSGWMWAVLVPLTELYEPQAFLPSHQVSEARPKIAELLQAAHAGMPQLLRRHSTAVAALMSAAPDERLNVEELLRAGATLTLEHDPGDPGDASEDNDVGRPPPPKTFRATAVDPSGAHIGAGVGTSVADALARLRRTPAEPPAESGASAQ
ncbi:MAG: type II toxin-antitoxin system prevent-host-death family antitoxin [Actinoplanes sp.]